jgi:ornithine cyclodeaminase/alanine dehydrogenase-like protein (mu-crystallin family)
VIFLNAADTRACLPMPDAISAMRVAFGGDIEAPLRSQLGSSLFMPGRVGKISAVKVVSVVPGNPVGIVAVFDDEGSPMGVVDGPTLTSIRTGAVAGLATELLAPSRPARLAMLGAGAMAFDQVEAVRAVRELEEILIWSRDRANAEALASRVGGTAVDRADQAVEEAGIVCCATPSTEPLFSDASVAPSTHINAVGAFRPEMVEVPSSTVDRAYVVVDDYEAARAEAGDLIQAGRDPNTSLPELLAGTHPAIGEDVTFFKSVGVASQDVAAAHRALHNAAESGRGTRLD